MYDNSQLGDNYPFSVCMYFICTYIHVHNTVATCKALWHVGLVAEEHCAKHQSIIIIVPVGASISSRHSYWHMSTTTSNLFLLKLAYCITQL